LPNALLHHLVLYNAERRDFICPKQWDEMIYAAGPEMTPWPQFPGAGYYVDNGDELRLEAMFANSGSEHTGNIFLELRLRYLIQGEDRRLKNIYPLRLWIGQCGASHLDGPRYDLVPGENRTATEVTLDFGGNVLVIGGHMHDHGVRLDVENISTHEMFAALPATLDSHGRLVSMPVLNFIQRGGYHLARGDTIRLTATYYNPSSIPLRGSGMAIAMGYFAPDEESQFASLRKVRQ
jgi:hypothetical protein